MIHSIIMKSLVLKKAKVVSLAKPMNSSSKISFPSTMPKTGLALTMISLEEWLQKLEKRDLVPPLFPFNHQIHPKIIKKLVIIIMTLVRGLTHWIQLWLIIPPFWTKLIASPVHCQPVVIVITWTMLALGMVSHEMSIITIFGHDHFNQKFHQ